MTIDTLKNAIKVEPFAIGFLEAEGKSIEYKVANGMLCYAKHRDIEILDGQMFAGNFTLSEFKPANTCIVTYDHGRGIHSSSIKLEENIKKYPELEAELREIHERMLKVSTTSVIHSKTTEHHNDILESMAGWGGGVRNWAGGHSNPDYMLHEGTIALRKKVEKFRKLNPGKDEFYDALVLCIDAMDITAQRYREYALEMAEKSEGTEKERFTRIANALEWVPMNKPRDFFEACQSYWLVFLMDGSDSPGNFDRVMIDYYRMNSEEDRRACLEGLWQEFRRYRAWNLCVGGSDENWNDTSNELTYAILETAKKYKYNTPNLTLRVHRNTPDDLWRLAAETIATGIGMPAIYNDECVCPALESFGITPEHSHKYCMNGCNQIDIYGISHMGLEDGEVCLAKCLEFVLTNGKCAISGKEVGLRTGEMWEYTSFEEFFAAYKEQVEYIAADCVRSANLSQRMMAKYCPNPHRSLLYEGCLEKGLDMKNGGPIYGHAQILIEGLADAVDSLASIKHFVFDEKKYTLTQVAKALSENYENDPEMYLDFKNYDKFGNDHDETNEIYREVVNHFNSYLRNFKSFRGGIFGGGCSTFQRAAAYGIMVGALPNGKKKGESLLADSIAATPGCDVNGPTALIKSVLSADQKNCLSGNVMQMKFTKNLFNTEKGIAAFIALAKTYFAGGAGQQLSINVLSREELLDAKAHPENYKDLIVRVGGYSDYFVRLPEGLRDNVIARTEIGL